MSDQTPDPWAVLIERMQGRMMAAWQCSVEGPEDTASLVAEAEAAFLRESLDSIAAARAAVEQQHAAQIAALTSCDRLLSRIGSTYYHGVSEQDAIDAMRSEIAALLPFPPTGAQE
jgi:hypothetical protein